MCEREEKPNVKAAIDFVVVDIRAMMKINAEAYDKQPLCLANE